MMAAKGVVYPVYQLMRDQGEPFDPAAYFPAIASYYADADGNMLSLPFNCSTPILYYNKDQFRAAGLEPDKPPRPGPSSKPPRASCSSAGVPCGFTTEWPSWINVENFSAYHDLPIATEGERLRRIGRAS